MDPRRRIWAAVALFGLLSLAQAVAGLEAAPSLDDRLLALGGLFALLVGTEGVVRPDSADLPEDLDALQYLVYGAVALYAVILYGGIF